MHRAHVRDGEDVAQDVEFRLFREFQAGKRYPGIPYRVVVHNVIRWTLAEHFQGRATDVPLPEGWEHGDGGLGNWQGAGAVDEVGREEIELGDADAPVRLAWGRGIPDAVADTIIPRVAPEKRPSVSSATFSPMPCP